MVLVVLWLSLVCQLGAAWMSLRVARRMSRPAWLALAFAMLFMAIRRVYLLYAYYARGFRPDLFSEINGLINAMLLLAGWWLLQRMLSGEPDAAPAAEPPKQAIAAAASGGGLARAAIVLGVLAVIGCITAGITAHFAIVAQLETQLAAQPHPSAADAAASAVWPWGVLFLTIALVFFPLALWLLHGAYSASRRGILRANDQLERHRETLRMILDAVPGGIIEVRPDLTFGDANDHALRILGVTREQLGGMTVNGFANATVLEDGTPCPVDRYPAIQTLRTGNPAGPTTIGVRAADGSMTWAVYQAVPMHDSAGKMTHAVVTFMDLTQLRQSESRFKAFMTHSPAASWIVDESGRYIYVSPIYLKMFRLPRQDLVGRLISEVYTPEFAESFLETNRRVLETKQMTESIESAPRFDGTVGQFLVYKFLFPGNEPHRLLGGVAVDITERRAAEKALRSSEEHYRQAAESNRRLLTEVNHRVRNNLAALMSLVALTRRKTTGVEAFADAIRSRLAAMTQVHNLLADVAYREIDLRSLLESLSASARLAAQHPVTIVIDGPAVSVSPRQTVPLAMALQELFTNSLKHGAFSAPGGQVGVAWSVHDTPAGAEVSLTWHESGGPPVKPQIIPSLGTDLIEGFVSFELGGRCRLTYAVDGVRHTIVFVMPPTVTPDNGGESGPGKQKDPPG